MLGSCWVAGGVALGSSSAADRSRVGSPKVGQAFDSPPWAEASLGYPRGLPGASLGLPRVSLGSPFSLAPSQYAKGMLRVC